MLCQAEELRSLALRALVSGGVDPADAAVVVDALLEAELRGRPTHGFIRLPGIRERFANRGPTAVTVVGDGGAWLHLDGGDGLGYVAAQRATDEARERAAKHGLALVGVRRGTHAGMLGYYTAQLAEAGLVAMMLANCVAMVAPYADKSTSTPTILE